MCFDVLRGDRFIGGIITETQLREIMKFIDEFLKDLETKKETQNDK